MKAKINENVEEVSAKKKKLMKAVKKKASVSK